MCQAPTMNILIPASPYGTLILVCMRRVWLPHPISCYVLVQEHQHPCSLRGLASRQDARAYQHVSKRFYIPFKGARNASRAASVVQRHTECQCAASTLHSTGPPPAPCRALEHHTALHYISTEGPLGKLTCRAC